MFLLAKTMLKCFQILFTNLVTDSMSLGKHPTPVSMQVLYRTGGMTALSESGTGLCGKDRGTARVWAMGHPCFLVLYIIFSPWEICSLDVVSHSVTDHIQGSSPAALELLLEYLVLSLCLRVRSVFLCPFHWGDFFLKATELRVIILFCQEAISFWLEDMVLHRLFFDFFLSMYFILGKKPMSSPNVIMIHQGIKVLRT